MNNETPYANSVFEQPWWLELVAANSWKEIIIRENEQVIARLPYVEIGSSIKMPKYTQTLGIWLADSVKEIKRGNEQLNKQKCIIQSIVEQLPSNKSVDIALDSSVHYILPFHWKGFNIQPCFSYRIDDLTDWETVESRFSKNLKRDINRGKRLLTIDSDQGNIDEFIALQNKTYERQNRKNPISNDLTKKIIVKAIELGHGRVTIARDSQGKPHAGSFALYDDNVCYHLMSGQDTDFGNDGAMPLLIAEEIKFAQLQSKAYDFEGSMIEGIEQMYRRFGGKQVTYWRIIKKSFIGEVKDILKPKVKRLIGYKM